MEAEVQGTIKSMKNHKAPGIDNITAEMMKAIYIVSWMTRICNQVWNSAGTLHDSHNGTIVTISKNGNLTECDN